MSDPIDRIAEVLNVHRWKSMGVRSVECECGKVISQGAETPTLTAFPADEAFRRHIAAEVTDALPSVLTETRERLERAVARLEEKRDDPSTRHTERVRLGGKVEGVKLALSYLEENTRIARPERE